METVENEKHSNTAEITELIKTFESQQLPRHKWTHEAYVTVALWYVCSFPAEQAVAYIRNGNYAIQAYNQDCGITRTPDSGYHEIITLF